MLKNGIYFTVMVLLVAEILFYANWMTCDAK